MKTKNLEKQIEIQLKPVIEICDADLHSGSSLSRSDIPFEDGCLRLTAKQSDRLNWQCDWPSKCVQILVDFSGCSCKEN